MNRTSPMPMMNAWRPAYRALGDHALAAGARVTMTGEGGDEWLTVGPEYMVDLLRGFDIAGLRLMLGTVLRSYDTSRSLLLYNMLWRFAARPLLASYGRDALRRVAPGRLAKHRLGQLEERSPDWVTPDPELQRELRARMEKWTAESLEEPEPRGPYAFYLSTLPGGFLHPLRSLDVEETFQSRRRTGLQRAPAVLGSGSDSVPLSRPPDDARPGRADQGTRERRDGPAVPRARVRTASQSVG